jgi:glucose-1-phosphate adenylyltransferase
MSKVLAIVLAGGEGKRLMPLTLDRAKPAVPFGGVYRLIDFALSNVVNSGYLRVVVLTQYKSHSLDKHIAATWRMSSLLGNYVAPVPAQQRMGKHWYLGSADAIYQSLNLIEEEKPDHVVVVGADHVYRMDFSQMVDAHIASGKACTVAAIRQPIEESDQFGVIETEADTPEVISRFVEKPKETAGLADDPTRTPPMTWAGTSSPTSWTRARPASTTSSGTTCPAPPTVIATTGVTSGPWTPSTRRTWI